MHLPFLFSNILKKLLKKEKRCDIIPMLNSYSGYDEVGEFFHLSQRALSRLKTAPRKDLAFPFGADSVKPL